MGETYRRRRAQVGLALNCSRDHGPKQLQRQQSSRTRGGSEGHRGFTGENVGIGQTIGFFAGLLSSRSIGRRLIAGEMSIMSPEFQTQPLLAAI
jgi:hypothetical protein